MIAFIQIIVDISEHRTSNLMCIETADEFIYDNDIGDYLQNNLGKKTC